jgi:hypothetical protein
MYIHNELSVLIKLHYLLNNIIGGCMFRISSMFFSFTLIVVFSFSVFAQNIQYTKGTSEVIVTPAQTEFALLYNQGTNIGTQTIASQQFGDFPTFACQAADDFVVPSPGWEINQIIAYGQNTGAFTSSLVEFYQNSSGAPGTVVATQNATTVNNAGTLTINLNPSVSLGAGTYWVSVSVIGDFGTLGQWFWLTHMTNNNGIWHWRNPGNGFGTGAVNYTVHTSAFPGSYTDNDLSFQLHGNVVPVELTSFTASAMNNDVVLNWATASEINNQGFEVERGVNGQFTKIGFVAGNGTTTEAKQYSYTDRNVSNGTYSYRLKQVDFDGTFEYSPVVEVDVAVPVAYTLGQNYPNPFNPSTTITFGLSVDSKVSLKVFDMLGQEIAVLVDGSLTAGHHEINFDASSLNSGVYFYTLEANGIDGISFMNTKKMILTK